MNSLDDFETESNLRNCESKCLKENKIGEMVMAIWDQGIGEYTHPCYDEYTHPSTDYWDYYDHWNYWDDDDHWNYWDDDDHWDHWDHDDYSDHWDYDDHENDKQRNDPWNLLIQDEVCNA